MNAAGHASTIVVMGVSGCGKTTLAKRLADTTGFAFIEADDHHTEANRRHMAAGLPLTDAMREPFVASLCAAIEAQQGGCVVAFSALRRAHRDRVRALRRPTLFLHLATDAKHIAGRMRARADHFMPVALLDSQFAALEPVTDEADVHVLDASGAFESIAAQAEARVRSFLHQRPTVASTDSVVPSS